MSKPFPLYFLPYVVLSEVYNIFNPQELVKLALCSRRSYEIAKSMKKKNKGMNIEIMYGGPKNIKIEFENGASFEFFLLFELSQLPQSTDSFEFLNFNGQSYRYRKGRDNSLEVYWDNDTFHGIRTLSEYICGLFQQPIHELIMSDTDGLKIPRRLIEWIMSRQKTLNSCNFECDRTDDTEIKYFMDNCKITEKLLLRVNPSPGFRHPLNLESVDIGDTHWMTVENLFELNSRVLGSFSSRFSSSDINRFLKNWMNGGNSRLQFFDITTEVMNYEQIFNGIAVTRRVHREDIEYHYYDDEPLQTDYTIDIRSVDGKIASVLSDDRDEIGRTRFLMVIWPDWKGRPYPIL